MTNSVLLSLTPAQISFVTLTFQENIQFLEEETKELENGLAEKFIQEKEKFFQTKDKIESEFKQIEIELLNTKLALENKKNDAWKIYTCNSFRDQILQIFTSSLSHERKEKLIDLFKTQAQKGEVALIPVQEWIEKDLNLKKERERKLESRQEHADKEASLLTTFQEENGAIYQWINFAKTIASELREGIELLQNPSNKPDSQIAQNCIKILEKKVEKLDQECLLLVETFKKQWAPTKEKIRQLFCQFEAQQRLTHNPTYKTEKYSKKTVDQLQKKIETQEEALKTKLKEAQDEIENVENSMSSMAPPILKLKKITEKQKKIKFLNDYVKCRQMRSQIEDFIKDYNFEKNKLTEKGKPLEESLAAHQQALDYFTGLLPNTSLEKKEKTAHLTESFSLNLDLPQLSLQTEFFNRI